MSESTPPAGDQQHPQLPDKAPRKKTGWVIAGCWRDRRAAAVCWPSRSPAPAAALMPATPRPSHRRRRRRAAVLEDVHGAGEEETGCDRQAGELRRLQPAQPGTSQGRSTSTSSSTSSSSPTTTSAAATRCSRSARPRSTRSTLYSHKYDAVKDIPEGASVAIPNDAINQARGLLVLQAASLLTLKGGGTALLQHRRHRDAKVEGASPSRPRRPPSRCRMVGGRIDHQQQLRGRRQARRCRRRSATTTRPAPTAAPYVNIFAARAKDAGNPLYQKLVDALPRSRRWRSRCSEANSGTAVFRTTTPRSCRRT